MTAWRVVLTPHRCSFLIKIDHSVLCALVRSFFGTLRSGNSRNDEGEEKNAEHNNVRKQLNNVRIFNLALDLFQTNCSDFRGYSLQ